MRQRRHDRRQRPEAELGFPRADFGGKNEGIEELIEHAIHVARYREVPFDVDFCSSSGEDGGAVHRCIHGVSHLIEDHAAAARIPLRFAATKLVEGDDLIIDALGLSENEREMAGHIVRQMEEESGLDAMAALADMRFRYGRLCRDRRQAAREQERRREAKRRINSDGEIYRSARLYPHHGAGVLPHLRLVRQVPVRLDGAGDRLAHRQGERGASALWD
ncbi:MAG: hypothetical protein ACLS4Z_02730 [Christensenellaceae bacterium]